MTLACLLEMLGGRSWIAGTQRLQAENVARSGLQWVERKDSPEVLFGLGRTP